MKAESLYVFSQYSLCPSLICPLGSADVQFGKLFSSFNAAGVNRCLDSLDIRLRSKEGIFVEGGGPQLAKESVDVSQQSSAYD